jgi:hypothetical protein
VSETALLSNYKQNEDDDALNWLRSYNQTNAKAPKQPETPAKAPEPVKPGGFFNRVTQGVADFIYPKAPVEGAGVVRRIAEKGIETMAGGAKDVGEAVAGTPPTEPQGAVLETPVGNIPVPDALHRAGKALMGGINATPAGGVIGAAGQTGREIQQGVESLSPSLTDEKLQGQIQQLQSVLSNPDAAVGMSPDFVEGTKARVAQLQKLLTMPYDERVKLAAEETGTMFELVAGAMPMPLFLGAGKAIKGVAGAAGGAAKEADAAAHAARIEAMRVAGEKLATERAAQQTAQQADQAKTAAATGGPRPPLTLNDIRGGMQRESTPGVKAGPSAPGSIPDNMMTLDKLHARERLAMLQRDPAAREAMDAIPEAKSLVSEPGADRVAGKTTREQNRTPLDQPSTVHPHEAAAAPTEDMSDELKRIAKEYDAAVTDPKSKPAWDKLASETDRMYEDIASKVNVEKVTGQPYASAEEMNKDIASGHFKVTTDNSDHPFWTEDQNWKFRVVHDYTGHFMGGNDFSMAGELEAFKAHVTHLTDAEAKGALQNEIVGQAASYTANGGKFPEQKAFVPKEQVSPSVQVTAYHGTSTTFGEYKGSQFFAEDPKTAGHYAHRQMLDSGAPAGDAPQIRPVTLKLERPATEEMFRNALDLMQGDREMAEELLKSKGYDGVRYEGADTGKGVHYLAFDAANQTRPLYSEAAKPLESAVDAAWARIKERFGLDATERGSVDLRGVVGEPGWEKNRKLWNDLVTVGTGKLWEMQSLVNDKFAEWAQAMTKMFGDIITPHLPEMFAGAQEQLKELGAKSEKIFSKQMPNLDVVMDLFHKGEHAAGWYDAAWEEMQRMFGQHAELYANVLAALSPHNGVKGNVTAANKAMAMILSGERDLKHPFTVTTAKKAGDGMQAHVDNLNRVLRGEPLEGPKVGPFSRALQGDRNAVVVDTWMMRAFGFTDKANESEMTFIQQAVTGMAEKLGMDARQVQAAIWTGVKVEREGATTFVEDIHKTIERSLLNKQSPLYEMFGKELADAKGLSEAGRINTGTMFVLGRAVAGAVVGGMTGDDPQTAARNALLGAGLGTVISSTLAPRIMEALAKPEVRQGLERVFKMQGEDGAIGLRFPKRGGESPNTARMGTGPEAKQLVRGINEKLSEAGKLDRDTTKPFDQVRAEAARSPFNTVEGVLGMDTAKLTLDELDGAITAARDVRDAALESVLQKAAQAKLSQDPALASEVVSEFLLAGRVSEQVTNAQTAYARGLGAQRMQSKASRAAATYDMATLENDIQAMRKALLDGGKTSDTQLVEMLTNLGDKAAAAKLAEAGSKWPPALWNIYYGLNLLSSPLTQFRNVIGNMGGLSMAVADRAFGEIMAAPFRYFGKTDLVQSGETYELAKGLFQVVGDTFRAAKDAKAVPGGMRSAFLDSYRTGESSFVNGGSKSQEMLRTLEIAKENGNGSLPVLIDAMSTLAQKNLRVMGGVDEVFKTLTFQGELRALALRDAKGNNFTGKALAEEIERLVANPDKDMLAMAEAAAHENTFTKAFSSENKGWMNLGGAGGKLEQAAQTPIAKLLISPFYRTPMRIGEFSTVHTPGLNFLAVQFYSDLAEGGVKANMAWAKLATGGAVVGLVGWYAAHGYITGNWPYDPALKASYERAGWKPKSLYVPFLGKYVSYDNFEPLSTMIGTVADTIQISRDLPEWHASTLMTAATIAAAKNSINKTWFQGVSDLVDVIEGANKGESVEKLMQAAENRLVSYVPGAAAMRLVANATDDQKRDRKRVIDNEHPELRQLDTLLNTFKAVVPGWSKTRPAIPNMITGEPLASENSWLGALSPFQYSTLKQDKVLQELVALNGSGLPKELPRAIGGSAPPSPFKFQGDEEREVREGILMSDQERSRLGTILTKEIEDDNGNTLHKALTELMDTDEYNDASDGRFGGKSRLMASKFQEFMGQAQQQLLDEYPKLDAAVRQRKILRDLGQLPKSMEDQKPDLLQQGMEAGR